MEKNYTQGIIDGLKMFGKACSSQGSCETCPMSAFGEAGMTCRQFIMQNPAKAASIFKEMTENGVTFYEEYCLRFPESGLSVEQLAECVCRKVVFEGDTGCDGEADCVECWKQKYVGEVEDKEPEKPEPSATDMTFL